MFNTKDIGRQVVSTYCQKCGQPKCICINKVDFIFNIWLQLTPDEKLRFAEKKIKWHTEQVGKK